MPPAASFSSLPYIMNARSSISQPRCDEAVNRSSQETPTAYRVGYAYIVLDQGAREARLFLSSNQSHLYRSGIIVVRPPAADTQRSNHPHANAVLIPNAVGRHEAPSLP